MPLLARFLPLSLTSSEQKLPHAFLQDRIDTLQSMRRPWRLDIAHDVYVVVVGAYKLLGKEFIIHQKISKFKCNLENELIVRPYFSARSIAMKSEDDELMIR